MRAEQMVRSKTGGWRGGFGADGGADLILYFGMRQALANGTRLAELKTMFPRAHILSGSTGGQSPNDDGGARRSSTSTPYGETAPHCASGGREPHTQTMTITVLNETRN